MSDEDQSVVAEALPASALYVVPDHVEERPSLRKKLEERGPAALTTTELLALILGPDGKRAAQALLARHGLAGIEGLTLDELRAIGSVSRGRATRLAVVLELHRRLNHERSKERPKLCRPRQVYDEVREIRWLKKEHLVGLYLDAQNHLLHRETLSVGSLNTTRTHPREILYPAIQHTALGFIMAHNHPSGSPEPSSEDLDFTAGVKRAGELMGIELYDHLVVAVDGFTSLRERGLL